MPKLINTDEFSAEMRSRAIDRKNGRLLVARLEGSAQEVDISEPVNCGGYGRVRHFKYETAENWPSNPLPIGPACKALGISPRPAVIRAQVFQNAACGWRCWYCFVPYPLLSADPKRSQWMTAAELVERYSRESDRPKIIDLSGGSPDLVPEWTLWMMRELKAAGLDNTTYLWTDDNLSTTYIFDKLDRTERQSIEQYQNYGRVCCFKGFDPDAFSFNTQAMPEGFDQQFAIMKRLIETGLDLYGYVTLTGPSDSKLEAKISTFMDRLQGLHVNLPLRIVPLQVRPFSPVLSRIDPTREKSMAIQELAIAAWNKEIATRYDQKLRTREIVDIPLM